MIYKFDFGGGHIAIHLSVFSAPDKPETRNCMSGPAPLSRDISTQLRYLGLVDTIKALDWL